MQMPPPDPDTLFEDLWQDLPLETVSMARACQAFVRAKKVKTPQQLLRVVFLYCGVDKSRRETAADFTLLYEAITDSAIAERLAACRPWVQAVVAKMLQTNAVATLPAPWRFLVMDGSHVQGPGAQGPQYRLHICMDWVQFQFVSMTVTEQPTGESLVHFPWGPGDIALADRGYAYAPPIVETVRKQADVILRMSPAHLPVSDGDGQRVALMQGLREPPWETSRTIDVRVQAPSMGERGTALSTRIGCQRSKPTWPDSASAPRVGKKGGRQRTQRCFGPGGPCLYDRSPIPALC